VCEWEWGDCQDSDEGGIEDESVGCWLPPKNLTEPPVPDYWFTVLRLN
jgi:hypothetical protein